MAIIIFNIRSFPVANFKQTKFHAIRQFSWQKKKEKEKFTQSAKIREIKTTFFKKKAVKKPLIFLIMVVISSQLHVKKNKSKLKKKSNLIMP